MRKHLLIFVAAVSCVAAPAPLVSVIDHRISIFDYRCASLARGQNRSATGQASAPTGNSGTWSGTIVSSSCNADEAFAESPECLKKVPGAKLALYDDTNRVVYSLEPQEIVVGQAVAGQAQTGVSELLGDSVTVRGTLDGETIHVASIELMTIGLAVGQKAPAFSAHDQSGRTQTLETLHGPNGTVLLFFRSADW